MRVHQGAVRLCLITSIQHQISQKSHIFRISHTNTNKQRVSHLIRLAYPPLNKTISTPSSIPSHLSPHNPRLNLDVGRGLLLWERSEAQVWLHDAELGEQGLGLVVGDGGVDDDVVSGDPVDGGGDAVLVTTGGVLAIALEEKTNWGSNWRSKRTSGGSQGYGGPQRCCGRWRRGKTGWCGWSSWGR